VLLPAEVENYRQAARQCRSQFGWSHRPAKHGPKLFPRDDVNSPVWFAALLTGLVALGSMYQDRGGFQHTRHKGRQDARGGHQNRRASGKAMLDVRQLVAGIARLRLQPDRAWLVLVYKATEVVNFAGRFGDAGLALFAFISSAFSASITGSALPGR
jgi:hypothetical protein